MKVYVVFLRCMYQGVFAGDTLEFIGTTPESAKAYIALRDSSVAHVNDLELELGFYYELLIVEVELNNYGFTMP